MQYRVKGYPKPFSERFETEKQALLRKAQIELEAELDTLTAPKTAVNPLTAPSKAVQADAGHRTEKMVTERYSAMRERRRNAMVTAMDTMLSERKMPAQLMSAR